MREQRKIKSVTELARYRVGDLAWWVILRPIITPALSEDDKWMREHHPKAFYERGPGKAAWSKALLPKLQHTDFNTLIQLLTSKLLIEQFIICDIVRSKDTGEFFYSNDNDEWIPESYLLTTQTTANKERLRIFRLIKKWVDNNS